MKKYDVAIFGAGLVGTICALLLARGGFEVLLLDVTKDLDDNMAKRLLPDIRMSAITLRSEEILFELGILDQLNNRFGIIKKMHIWDANSFGEISFDALSIGKNYLCKLIENNLLLECINNIIKHTSNITVKRSFVFNSIDIIDAPEGSYNSITGMDNHIYTARLIIGSDGTNSRLRSYYNFDLNIEDYNHSALVTTVYTTMPHNNIAYQVFLPDGPLAFLPWKEAHCCSIVWSQSPIASGQWLKCEEKEFNNKLQQYIGYKLGAIVKSDARFAFPVMMRHVTQYYKNSCVLIGDAAHTIHPLAGQGLNLGIYDARALADCLIWAKNKNYQINSQHVLRKYELQRRGHNQQTIYLMNFFKKIYSIDNLPVNLLRNLGMNLIDHSSFVKKQITRQAAGFF